MHGHLNVKFGLPFAFSSVTLLNAGQSSFINICSKYGDRFLVKLREYTWKGFQALHISIAFTAQ